MALTDRRNYDCVNVLSECSQEQSSKNMCIQNWNFMRTSAFNRWYKQCCFPLALCITQSVSIDNFVEWSCYSKTSSVWMDQCDNKCL